MLIRRIIVSTIVSLVAVLTVVTASLCSAELDVSGGTPVVVVGDVRLDRYELEEAIDSFIPMASFHGGVSPDTRRRYVKPALDLMIERELLFRAALKEGVKPDANEVEKLVEWNVSNRGSRAEFRKSLKTAGVSWEEFMHKVRKKVVLDQMRDTLEARARLNEAELKTYYTDNSGEFKRPPALEVWHILIKIPANADGKTRKAKKEFAARIAARAKEGEDFTLLAERYSDGDYRVKGGRLGMVHYGQLVKDLENVVFSLNKDEVAGPIETIYGYHIVKAGNRQELGMRPFEEVKDELKKRLEKERYQELKSKIVEEIKTGVNIKILIDTN